jgi:hypothetical protein
MYWPASGARLKDVLTKVVNTAVEGFEADTLRPSARFHFLNDVRARCNTALKLTDSVNGNDSHLSRTIHAFPRQTQTWTKHDLRLATEKKPKTPFPKRNGNRTSLRKRKRALFLNLIEMAIVAAEISTCKPTTRFSPKTREPLQIGYTMNSTSLVYISRHQKELAANILKLYHLATHE